MSNEIQTSLQFVLGGLCGAGSGIVVLCYLFGWHKRQAFGRAIKLFLGLFAVVSLSFIFARLFDLWGQTANDPRRSLELLKVISNFAIAAAIGGAIVCISQYQAKQIRRQERQDLSRHDQGRYFARLGED